MRVVLLLKQITLVIITFQFSLESHSFKSKEIQIHERLGTLKASSSDTVYLHVLTGESFVFQAGLRRNKLGGSIEVQNMQGKVLLSDPKFKNLRKELPADETNNAIRIILSNLDSTDAEVKFLVFRKTNAPEIQVDHHVYWRTVKDTLFKWIDKPYVIKKDTVLKDVVDDLIKVHSTLNMHENETYKEFYLPENTIHWCIYAEVDQGGQSAYEQGMQAVSKLGSSTAKYYAASPLVPLMLSMAKYIPQLQQGEDVGLTLYSGEGKSRTKQEIGLVVNTSQLMYDNTPQMYSMRFHNDNAVMGIRVMFKVQALCENNTYEYRHERVVDTIVDRKEWYVR